MKTHKRLQLLAGFLLTSVVLLACGCAASPSKAPDSVPYAANYGSGGSSYAAQDMDGGVAMEREMLELAAGESGIADVPVAQGRKIVRTANFSISTKGFDEDLASLRAAVSDAGGFFEQADISNYGGDTPRSGYLVARLPETRFDSFLEFLRTVGEVTNESTRDTDLTERYVDTQIRIDVLEQNLKHLQELQLQSDDVETVIRLQQEINDVLLQLESMTSELRHMDAQIDYATVTVTLHEQLEAQINTGSGSLWDNIASGFVNSSNGVFAFLRGLLVVLAMLLPVFALLAAGFGVFLVIFRLCAKRWPFSKKNRKPKAPPPHMYPPQMPAPPQQGGSQPPNS